MLTSCTADPQQVHCKSINESTSQQHSLRDTANTLQVKLVKSELFEPTHKQLALARFNSLLFRVVGLVLGSDLSRIKTRLGLAAIRLGLAFS